MTVADTLVHMAYGTVLITCAGFDVIAMVTVCICYLCDIHSARVPFMVKEVNIEDDVTCVLLTCLYHLTSVSTVRKDRCYCVTVTVGFL